MRRCLLALLLVWQTGALEAPVRRRLTVGQSCFWSPQETLSNLPGVEGCTAGYLGLDNSVESTPPTYSSVCAGDGRVEAVTLTFDDKVITFERLLQQYLQYWRSLPSLPPKGSQYSPCLIVETEDELALAKAAMSEEELAIHTVALRSASTAFWAAEGYHQQYESKQRPRNLMLVAGLGTSFVGDTTAHQIGSVLLAAYCALNLGERLLGDKVKRVF